MQGLQKKLRFLELNQMGTSKNNPYKKKKRRKLQARKYPELNQLGTSKNNPIKGKKRNYKQENFLN